MRRAFSYVRFSHPDQRKGDSFRRQTDLAEAYAKEHGLVVDTSLKPDLAISAYRGKNRKTGNLAAFLNKITTGDVPRGSALLLESLDRLSREELEESFDLLRSIVRAGVEVHTISDRQVYRKGHMDAQQMIMSIFVLARSNEESKRKSERCAAVAAQSRERARNGEVVTSKVPGWMTVNGDKFEIVPEHVQTIKEIFRLALDGNGANKICDELIREKRATWTYRPRWSPSYVSTLLRARHVVGEYQPGKCPRGCKRTEEGEPIQNYYPQVIDEDTWNKVQRIRAANFGHGKVAVGNAKGKGRSTWRNIFVGLLYDQDGNTVIYKQSNKQWEYLTSSDRSKFKQRTLKYAPFKEAILSLLNDIDWQSLIDVSNPELQKELAEVEALIGKNEARLSRYNRMLDLDDEPPELLWNKIKIAQQEAKDLDSQRERLLSRAASSQSLSGIPTITVNQTVRESNIRLREELRRRIERIDITFGATVLTTPGVKDVQSGTGKIVAKLTFASGAVKWAFIDKDRAVLLS